MKSSIIFNGKLVETIAFSGGEIQAKFPSTAFVHEPNLLDDVSIPNKIEARIKCNSGLIVLMQLVNMLRFSYPRARFNLKLPYVPYGRYDRRMEKVDSLSLKIFCDMINNLNFESVTVEDPHSYVIENLLNNCKVLTQLDGIKDIIKPDANRLIPYTAIVAPDTGSTKKASDIADYYNLPKIQCDKWRDPETKRIGGFTIYYDDLSTFQEDVLIVDDICDGGGTFIGLAESLKQASGGEGRVDLYVTHGIFSKGIEPLLEHIDNVYCKYSWINSDRINFSELY